jgi:transcriptional regulator with XRE-family HTH domain
VQLNKNIKKIVAANLKARRESLGMTQAELARRSKLTARYISILEAKPRNLTLESMAALCDQLGITVCELTCEQVGGKNSRRNALETALALIQQELRLMEY